MENCLYIYIYIYIYIHIYIYIYIYIHIHYLVGEKAILLDIARVCDCIPTYFYEPPVNENIVRELINNTISPLLKNFIIV